MTQPTAADTHLVDALAMTRDAERILKRAATMPPGRARDDVVLQAALRLETALEYANDYAWCIAGQRAVAASGGEG